MRTEHDLLIAEKSKELELKSAELDGLHAMLQKSNTESERISAEWKRNEQEIRGKVINLAYATIPFKFIILSSTCSYQRLS